MLITFFFVLGFGLGYAFRGTRFSNFLRKWLAREEQA